MSACGCWSASARRWCRPATSPATMSHGSPSARWRWPGSRRMMPMSARGPVAVGAAVSRSRPARSAAAVRCGLERRAREAEEAALAVAGVSKSGGASASAGIAHGAGHQRRLPRRLSALEPRHLGHRDRRRRHRMERDYDFTSALHAADLAAPAEVDAGRRAPVARLNPRRSRPARCRGVRPAGGGLAGSASGRRRQRRGGARSQLPQGPPRPAVVRKPYPHRRRSAARARARSQPFDAEGVAVKGSRSSTAAY